MKLASCLALAAALSGPAVGLVLHPRKDGAPRVVSLSTQRKKTTNPVKRDRLRRRGSISADLDNEETLYFVNGTLGTPPQSFRLHLDTGSSDLWVNSLDSDLCGTRQKLCEYAGTYEANSSSTYEYVGSYFNISYVDGSGASGDYVTDTFTIGETTLDKFQFGVGYVSSSSQGILGVGYEANEVQVGRANLDPYKNLPSQMVADGKIASKSFSLWLNDLESDTGNILFGGVDTTKYSGTLQTLPVQANGGVFSEFLITMTELSIGNDTVASDQALAVLLDSGSSLTYLPDEMVQRIYTDIEAQYDAEEGAAYVPCEVADEDVSLIFTFSGPTIDVAMREMVLQLVTSDGKRPTFSDGRTACLFGLAPAGSGTNVLGDTFLRSAYVVYDLDNNQVSLAQTKFNATGSDVQEIGTGTDAVPGATVVANAVSATAGILRGTTGAGGLGVEDASPASALVVGLFATVATAFAAGILLVA